MKKLILLLVLGVAAWKGYRHFNPEAPGDAPPSAVAAMAPAAAPVRPVESAYRCDGRIHCSQMRSCDEATYFIRHCPNTQMDGDGDGVPCERQWCG